VLSAWLGASFPGRAARAPGRARRLRPHPGRQLTLLGSSSGFSFSMASAGTQRKNLRSRGNATAPNTCGRAAAPPRTRRRRARCSRATWMSRILLLTDRDLVRSADRRSAPARLQPSCVRHPRPGLANPTTVMAWSSRDDDVLNSQSTRRRVVEPDSARGVILMRRSQSSATCWPATGAGLQEGSRPLWSCRCRVDLVSRPRTRTAPAPAHPREAADLISSPESLRAP